ncbi:hypothetical protein ACWDTI_04935 [Gordonia sp. NPDC003424]
MRTNRVDDLEAAMASPIVFEPDPDDRLWYRGNAGADTLYLRMGNFPDEPLYSLYLGHGRWMDFTSPPDTWTVNTPSEGWPESARERLPKGQFHV